MISWLPLATTALKFGNLEVKHSVKRPKTILERLKKYDHEFERLGWLSTSEADLGLLQHPRWSALS